MTENTQNKMRTYLTTEVKYVIGIATFILGVVAPYYSIRENISLIQKDISTMQKTLQTHTETKTAEQDRIDNELRNDITRIETKLGIKETKQTP